MTRRPASAVILLVSALSTGVASATPLDQRVADLEAQVRALTEELQRLRPEQPPPPPAASTQDLERKVDALAEELQARRSGVHFGEASESAWGLGPAASKVYAIDRGVSIGGYGEMLYQGFDAERDDGSRSNAKDTADFLRAVLYVGYKFSDHVVFNSEIEFEHAQAGEGAGGEVAVEFANVDFLIADPFNVRAGLVLMPVGFLNELHEPATFLGAARPDVERVIIPSTWRENGVLFFGEKGPFSYRAGLVAGLDASGFSAGNGIRGGRQQGSRSVAEDLGFVARFDVEPVAGLRLGASGFMGDSGQDAKLAGEEVGASVSLWEAHAQLEWKGLHLRALYAEGSIDDVTELNTLFGHAGADSIGTRQHGWYGEIGHDVLAHLDTEQELIPFARYEEFDTQAAVPDGFLRNPANDRSSWTFGLSYKPHPQVVIKLDCQDRENAAGTAVDQVNLGVGYSF